MWRMLEIAQVRAASAIIAAPAPTNHAGAPTASEKSAETARPATRGRARDPTGAAPGRASPVGHAGPLRVEDVLVQAAEGLLDARERQREVHADVARTVEGAAVLPVDAHAVTGALQLVDAHAVLLAPL